MADRTLTSYRYSLGPHAWLTFVLVPSPRIPTHMNCIKPRTVYASMSMRTETEYDFLAADTKHAFRAVSMPSAAVSQ